MIIRQINMIEITLEYFIINVIIKIKFNNSNKEPIDILGFQEHENTQLSSQKSRWMLWIWTKCCNFVNG